MSVDLTNGLIFDNTPEHYIVFGGFDSRDYGLHLHERTAPTPDEKLSTYSVPYMQGEISKYPRGCRIYENREITYTFYHQNVKKTDANVIQTTIENQIMREVNQVLIDSYDPHYHYVGKCSGIDTTDDYEYRRLIIEITLDLYPFKISDRSAGNELWNSFNFKTDVFQKTKFEVNEGETRTIKLYNNSQLTHVPTIIATMADPPDDVGIIEWIEERAALKIKKNGTTYGLHNGENTISQLKLDLGLNTMTLTGIGTIEFVWYRELI